MTSDNNATEAVLLVAHGSRVPESNAEIETLAGRLAAHAGAGATVSHAFLELARPSIAEAIDALAGDGARRIVVIPYFLSAGRHVVDDIPAIVADARRRHPQVELVMTTHFGARDEVPALLAAMAAGGDPR